MPAYTVLTGSAGPAMLELSDSDRTSRRARGALDRHRRKDVKDLPGAIGNEPAELEVFLQEDAVPGEQLLVCGKGQGGVGIGSDLNPPVIGADQSHLLGGEPLCRLDADPRLAGTVTCVVLHP